MGGIVLITARNISRTCNCYDFRGQQVIARGPVAAFEIIKQLGGERWGLFCINSAHPFENLGSNLLEILAMICIPAADLYTYGLFANNTRQGLLFWMVFVIFVILVGKCRW